MSNILGTLYIRRRNQLLRENAKKGVCGPLNCNNCFGAIAEYPASLFPVGGILWRTSQNTIEVILMQINGPGILQFSPNSSYSNSSLVCFWFIIFRPRIQSCGTEGVLTKMAAIKIAWLQILACANNGLLVAVFFLDQWPLRNGRCRHAHA